ncbi:MAG: hypothetical protein KF685_10020 [Acidobacteria bacterium]|nr:hypothetical protein [Acidobacteriota bacterium]
MINARILAVFVLVISLTGGMTAQSPANSTSSTSSSSKVSGKDYLPLTSVKEGMKGKAWTVFRGSEPEPFDVEILGIVPGSIGPKQDLIIGRISGGQADRTAVFAGMSGSPVYVDGKLIGAISYSFPFAKEAICGITPIEQMVSIFDERSKDTAAPGGRSSFSFAEIASAGWDTPMPSGANAVDGGLIGAMPGSMLSSVAGQSFRRIGTPMTFSGFRQETLDLFGPKLIAAGLVPVAAAGGSAKVTPMKKADENTLKPGASVTMQLSRGDYTLASHGTVTERDGEKIYAFGHPFLSLGASELPMSESSVVIVIPNMNNSFKMAIPGDMVGTMTQDRATGVYGKLGLAPKMIPVKLNLTTSRGQKETLDFEIAKDDFLTPLLLNITIYNSIVALERGIGDLDITIDGDIKLAGQPVIPINRRYAGAASSQMAATSVSGPVNVLLRSRFEDLEITGINLNIASAESGQTAVLDRVSIDRSEVKAGETITLRAFARTPAGRVFVQEIPFTIPKGTPEGKINLTVGDGSSIQRDEAIQQFVPGDLSELVGIINKVKTPDRLYLKITRTTQGAVIGASEMPNLPPSVLATINSGRTTGGITKTTQTVVSETLLPPSEFLISGNMSLTLDVGR